MKTRFLYLAGVALLVTSCINVPTRPSVKKDKKDKYPNFDLRRARTAKPTAVEGASATEITRIKEKIAGLQVDFDALFGAPKFVHSTKTFLTELEPGSDNAAMLPQGAPVLQRARPDRSDSHWALKQFLNQNNKVFGYDAGILTTAQIKRVLVSTNNQLRTVVWQQEVEGLPVFEATLVANFTRGDSLVSLSSRFSPDRNPVARTSAVEITALRAMALASRSIGETNAVASDFTARSESQGKARRQKFSGSPVLGEAEASLVWLPTDRSTLRLCWRIVLTGQHSEKLYQVLIDARTGEVWLRHCWSGDAIPLPGQTTTYLVFDKDSAAPLLPGWPTPSIAQPPVASQTQLTLTSLSTNASPLGWVNTNPALFGLTNTTFGNNVDAHLDWTNARSAYGAMINPPRPAGSITNGQIEFTGDAFTANLDQSATNAANRNAATLNAFYWCNWMHDVLYDLGFDEEAGNFQYDNFGRGTNSIGNDPVRMHVQSGAASGLRGGGIFAASPEDGNPGQIWITLMGDANASRDGVFDATLLLHEYTHFLSARLVGNGVGISAYQTLGLAEGWSDFYALALLSESEDDVNGTYPFMGYASYHWRTATFEQNYYFGPRAYPYSTDMTKNPMTLGFLQLDPAFDPYPDVPINPLYHPTNSVPTPLPLDEPHAFGQVWGQALWDARAYLIQKHGFTNGNWLMLQLVTDGMKLGPANPTFLEARDSVLLADRLRTGGRNSFELWTAFARRGMGYSATNAPSDYTTLDTAIPVRESFSVPPFVEIKSSIYSSPAIGVDGTIYVGSTNGRLYAVSNSDTEEFPGKIKWSFGGLTTNYAFNSSPAISPTGVIYVGGYDSNLYAIASSGAMIWRTNLGGKIFSSPALATDGTVCVGSSNGKFYAVNPDGTVKWSIPTSSIGSNILSSPAVALNGTIYVGSMHPSTNLYALNPTNGSPLPGWPVTVVGGVYSSPAIDTDGSIYVGGLDGKVYAFTTNGNARNGWPVATGGAIYSSPAIGSSGVVYVGSSDMVLYAINSDGTTNWTYKTRGAIKSSPALGQDGTVFVGSEDGNLHVINSDGTGRWVYPVGGPVASSPVIDSAGGLYVGSTAGNLYYLPTGTPFADGPWTMFRQNFRHTGNARTLVLRPPQATNGIIRLEVTGPAEAECEVEVATSFPPSWSLLTSLTLTNGVGTIEISPTESHQFYRAKFSH